MVTYQRFTFTFTANKRCLSFRYIFPTNAITENFPSSVSIFYEGDGLAKTNALMLTKKNATEAWVDQEVTIPSVNNLKVCFLTLPFHLSIYLKLPHVLTKISIFHRIIFVLDCFVCLWNNKHIYCLQRIKKLT